MKGLLRISGYPAVLVFALAGVSAVIVAYASYNLLSMSMANLHFLRRHGWDALATGGLIQLLLIIATGAVALFFFVIFKICEAELVARYRRWQEK